MFVFYIYIYTYIYIYIYYVSYETLIPQDETRDWVHENKARFLDYFFKSSMIKYMGENVCFIQLKKNKKMQTKCRCIFEINLDFMKLNFFFN